MYEFRVAFVARIVLGAPWFGACERPIPPRTAPIAETASADGIPIKYETVGAGDVALVFVHCWTCNRGFWDARATFFAPHCQVVRLDLAGHGESGKGRKAYTIAAFGADVAAVVDKLELFKEAILVGHSMGGPVALAAQATWPSCNRHCRCGYVLHRVQISERRSRLASPPQRRGRRRRL